MDRGNSPRQNTQTPFLLSFHHLQRPVDYFEFQMLSLHCAGCFVLDDCKGHSNHRSQNIPISFCRIYSGPNGTTNTLFKVWRIHIEALNRHHHVFILFMHSIPAHLQGRGLKIRGHQGMVEVIQSSSKLLIWCACKTGIESHLSTFALQYLKLWHKTIKKRHLWAVQL